MKTQPTVPDNPEQQARASSNRAGDVADNAVGSVTGALENRYYAYLRGQGYSSSDALLDVLRVYLPYFEGLETVADLGCGHGEFMAMLRAAGHTVRGVDVDPGMVAACQKQGFDVTLGDAAAWLRTQPDHFDALFSSNVIEHLPAATVRNWIDASYTALRPGGMLLLATPNPASAIVQFHEFWRDATHVRMYSAQLVEFLLVDGGFTSVQSLENKAARWEGIDAMLDNVESALPQTPMPQAAGAVPPLPAAPATGNMRARWAYKLTDWIYRKFSEPYILPLRDDLARIHAILDEQARALALLQEHNAQLVGRLRALAGADRFLHPSREIAILGYKPVAPANDDVRSK